MTIYITIRGAAAALSILLPPLSLCSLRAQAAKKWFLSPASIQEKHWALEHLIRADADLPFSFVYDGQPSARLLSSWSKTSADEQLDSIQTKHTASWTDPRTGLQVTCVAVEFADFPVVEWTVYFKNSHAANTPILEKIEEWLLLSPDDPVIRKQINQGVILGNRSLLNLGNPAANRWLVDRLSKLIDEEGIKIYRQDFNIMPLLFWR